MVLDIFFEALNYEKIEQKKAYEVAGLLGKCAENSHMYTNMENIVVFCFNIWFVIIFVYSLRWYWWSDGSVYWSQCLDNIGDIWLFIWGLHSRMSDLSLSFAVMCSWFKMISWKYIWQMLHHFQVFKDKVLGPFLRKRRPHRSASDNLVIVLPVLLCMHGFVGIFNISVRLDCSLECCMHLFAFGSNSGKWLMKMAFPQKTSACVWIISKRFIRFYSFINHPSLVTNLESDLDQLICALH